MRVDEVAWRRRPTTGSRHACADTLLCVAGRLSAAIVPWRRGLRWAHTCRDRASPDGGDGTARDCRSRIVGDGALLEAWPGAACQADPAAVWARPERQGDRGPARRASRRTRGPGEGAGRSRFAQDTHHHGAPATGRPPGPQPARPRITDRPGEFRARRSTPPSRSFPISRTTPTTWTVRRSRSSRMPTGLATDMTTRAPPAGMVTARSTAASTCARWRWRSRAPWTRTSTCGPRWRSARTRSRPRRSTCRPASSCRACSCASAASSAASATSTSSIRTSGTSSIRRCHIRRSSAEPWPRRACR